MGEGLFSVTVANIANAYGNTHRLFITCNLKTSSYASLSPPPPILISLSLFLFSLWMTTVIWFVRKNRSTVASNEEWSFVVLNLKTILYIMCAHADTYTYQTMVMERFKCLNIKWKSNNFIIIVIVIPFMPCESGHILFVYRVLMSFLPKYCAEYVYQSRKLSLAILW